MISGENERVPKIGGKILTGRGQKKQWRAALHATVKAGEHCSAKS